VSRTIVRGYKTELDLNNGQKTACLQHAGAARWAYNWGLTRKKEVYAQTGKSLSAMQLHKELNALKKTAIPWMYTVSKCAPQEALRDLDRACTNFLRTVKKATGRKWNFPGSKSKKNGINSFRLTGSIHVFDATIRLPHLGVLRLKEHSYLPTNAHVLSATISHQAGRWYISVQVREEPSDPLAATAAPIGIDLGVKALATISDGRMIVGPKALRQHLKQLRRANKRLHRRRKGSRNRKKAQERVAQVHVYIAHIRADTLHQTTSLCAYGFEPRDARTARKEACRAVFPEAKTKQEERWQNKQVKKSLRIRCEETADLAPCVLVIEDLNVSGMLKNRHLARAVSDVGLHEFRRQLTYKADLAGSEILVASRWYPSSKQCSWCGWKDEDQTLADRLFVCSECGLVMDRDFNAARNLEALAYDVQWNAKKCVCESTSSDPTSLSVARESMVSYTGL
jgi:putative transposase